MIIEENLEFESVDSDEPYHDMELKSLKKCILQRALAALECKYENFCKAVEDDFMLFQDYNFKIDHRGEDMAEQGARDHSDLLSAECLALYLQAYCNVTCSELTLEAIKLGAEAISVSAMCWWNDNKGIPHIFIENQGRSIPGSR